MLVELEVSDLDVSVDFSGLLGFAVAVRRPSTIRPEMPSMVKEPAQAGLGSTS